MGVPPAVVPAVRRQPGMRLVTGVASEFRAALPPARTERSPGAPQQARSPRARVRDRPHRARPTDMGRGRSLRSRARQRRAPGPEPLLRAELGRLPLSTGRGPPPARASRLPQRCGWDLLVRRGAALVALRDERRGFVSSAGASPDPGAASGCRGRGRAGVRSPRGVLRPDPPAGDVRRRTLLVGQLTGSIVGRRLRLRRRRRTTPDTASGSSPPTSTRPTGSSTTVDAPVSSTEPTGGSRGTSRRSRSSSLSLQPRTTPRSGTSRSSPGTRSGMRRTGGSRSSASSGGRRLAPRRLGSGRLRRADAEARRHGRHRHDRVSRARMSERTPRGLSPCSGHVESSPGGPRRSLRGQARCHLPTEPRLPCRRRLEAAVHAPSTTSVPRRVGAIAFRSPRRTSSSPFRRSGSTDFATTGIGPRCGAPVRSTRRR